MNCIVCKSELFQEPTMRYRNMPRSAQYLPDHAMVRLDGGKDLDVWQCTGCGLVQLVDVPVPYYREVIRAAGLSPEMHAFRTTQLRTFVEEHSLTGKRVIEIGCGRGEYLALLRDTGVEAHGLEHSPYAVAACWDAGLNAHEGYVERANTVLNGAPFDAFVMFNFLEHFPDPNDALQGIRNNLAPGGVGLIEVPNFDVISSKGLFAEFVTDHLLYFTTDTLTTALSLNGFEVLSCSKQFHDYFLSATVRRRRPLDPALFHANLADLMRVIYAYMSRFARVAVWGAGHQAFALMSLLDLRSVCYVVDSAPFKQGKLTPVTHVPIVAPEVLKTDPVDALIIMAGGYSEEVARTVRADLGLNLDVVIVDGTRLTKA